MLNRTMIMTVPVVMTAALVSVPAHADSARTSIRNAIVYDTNNKVMSGTKKLSYAYVSGKAVCPIAKVVTKDGKTLSAKDYDFLTYYFKNRKPGTATAVIRGNHKRGYKDAIIIRYKITRGQSSSSGSGGSASGGSSSSGSSSSSGNGALSGSRSSNLLDISQATAADIPDQIYTGKALTPSVSLYYNGKKVLAKYYKVSYAHNVAIGTATATVTGNGDVFQGTKSVSFNIVAATGTFKVGTIAAQKYSGTAITPKPSVSAGNFTLKEGTDYTLSYANNVVAGTATITVTGIGRYVGFEPKTVSFQIFDGTSTAKATAGTAKAISVNSAKVTMNKKFYTTALRAVTPKPTVRISGKTLKSGRDYTLTYKNNIKPGTASVTIKGKGGYKGSKTVKFTLVNIGDDLAYYGCTLAYSQGRYKQNGKYPWTRRAQAGWVKIGFSNNYNYGWYSCTAGIRLVGRASGFDKSCLPWPKGNYGDVEYLRDSAKWTYVGNYSPSKSIKANKLMPGDVLVHKDHVFMYVGTDIAQKAYKKVLKGTNADTGKPNGPWLSSHMGNGGAALGIGNGSWACTSYKGKSGKEVYKIYRCTKPSNSAYRSGAVVK